MWTPRNRKSVTLSTQSLPMNRGRVSVLFLLYDQLELFQDNFLNFFTATFVQIQRKRGARSSYVTVTSHRIWGFTSESELKDKKSLTLWVIYAKKFLFSNRVVLNRHLLTLAGPKTLSKESIIGEWSESSMGSIDTPDVHFNKINNQYEKMSSDERKKKYNP